VRNTAVRHLSIWYPQQMPAAIVPYPWTIHAEGAIHLTNLTFYNSYQGIELEAVNGS
jgi:hypothetical protein